MPLFLRISSHLPYGSRSEYATVMVVPGLAKLFDPMPADA